MMLGEGPSFGRVLIELLVQGCGAFITGELR